MEGLACLVRGFGKETVPGRDTSGPQWGSPDWHNWLGTTTHTTLRFNFPYTASCYNWRRNAPDCWLGLAAGEQVRARHKRVAGSH